MRAIFEAAAAQYIRTMGQAKKATARPGTTADDVGQKVGGVGQKTADVN